MGPQLSGWLEVRESWGGEHSAWQAVAEITPLLHRGWGSDALFDTPLADPEVDPPWYAPLAPERGAPSDRSVPVMEAMASQHRSEFGYFAPSWVTWAEIEAHWDTPAFTPRLEPHTYRRSATGELQYYGSSPWTPDLAASAGLDYAVVAAEEEQPELEGHTWEANGVVYRVERGRWRDAFDEPWWILFDLMRTLAARFGSGGVRLVVWFHW
jgi:hypothetical protein